jgi:magnesium-transporting ATPase (P-type)
MRETDAMKQLTTLSLFLFMLMLTLSSCELVGGIFKAGFWTAVILIIVVVLLIVWLFGRRRR